MQTNKDLGSKALRSRNLEYSIVPIMQYHVVSKDSKPDSSTDPWISKDSVHWPFKSSKPFMFKIQQEWLVQFQSPSCFKQISFVEIVTMV